MPYLRACAGTVIQVQVGADRFYSTGGDTMNEHIQVVYKTIDELIPYANNPRQNDDAVEPVAESIKEFGFKVPMLIDANGVIVAGHTRLRAAKLLGMDRVPCIIADDLTEEQIRAYRLIDNRTADLSEWDFDKLKEELAEVTEIDMSVFGFDPAIADDGEALENFDLAFDSDYKIIALCDTEDAANQAIAIGEKYGLEVKLDA